MLSMASKQFNEVNSPLSSCAESPNSLFTSDEDYGKMQSATSRDAKPCLR